MKTSRPKMTKQRSAIFLAVIFLLFVFAILIYLRDFRLSSKTIECGDGKRQTIDIRDFTTSYSGYSLIFEATIADKAKVSGKISPVQLQQLSDSIQSMREFRKYVVAGYNSCAVSKEQFGKYGVKFQAIDNVAREIEEFLAGPTPSTDRDKNLAILVEQYKQLVRDASLP
jgi:hypothetical protein